MQSVFLRRGVLRWTKVSTIAAVCLTSAIACVPPDSATDAPMEETASTEVPEVVFSDVESPDGGMVKQLSLPGPQSAVLIACDQEGFFPFAYSDSGMNWVGCQVPNPNDPVGAESALTDPAIAEVESPVGGMVQQVTIPGPQRAIVVACEGDFEPFLYEDQGTWVGCQAP